MLILRKDQAKTPKETPKTHQTSSPIQGSFF